MNYKDRIKPSNHAAWLKQKPSKQRQMRSKDQPYLPNGPVDIWAECEEDVLHSGQNSRDKGDAVGAKEIRVFEGIVIRVMKQEVRPRDQNGADQRECHCQHLRQGNATTLQHRLER